MEYNNPYAVHGNKTVAAMAAETERIAFIQRTYLHLTGAIFAFALLETILLMVIPPQAILGLFAGPYSWLIVLGAFMGVSFLANYWASSDTSPALQYAGLGLYVVAEAIIFLPLLMYAIETTGNASIPLSAGITTLIMFGGLTAMVFTTGANLTWMGKYLAIAGFGAIAIVVASVFMGFSLGILFSAAMITFACGYILYDTSNVMHNYRTTQHVAAALALFASVALLFWYVVRIFIALSSND